MDKTNYDEAINDYEEVNGYSTLRNNDSNILLLILAELKAIKKDIHTIKINKYGEDMEKINSKYGVNNDRNL